MEESLNREFIADILTIATIAISLWLTGGERDDTVLEKKVRDTAEHGGMFRPFGELSK